MPRVLRCYAEGQDDGWEAICLDLDLAAQGSTFEHVYHEMTEAIGLYLDTVAELPEAERRRLLYRPASLGVRLKFLWHALRAVLHDDTKNPKLRAEFTTICPA
jgi:predicted RNase H-like HicB family nuclease